MPETKRYCTELPEEVVKISETNHFAQLGMCNEDEELGIEGSEESEDGIEQDYNEDEDDIPTEEELETCEENSKSIGCKVLGNQFIFTLNGLIKDLEELKPPGYILAIGKLKGAIIKLQAGD